MTTQRPATSGLGPIELGPDGRPPVTGGITVPELGVETRAIRDGATPASTADQGSGSTPPPHEPPPGSPPGGSRYARLARRASWNITDQVITALTNTLLFVVLARSVGLAQLDAFTNAFYVFTLVIGVGRALVGQVLSVRFSDVHGSAWRTGLTQAFGFIVGLTVTISVVVAAVGGALWLVLDRPGPGRALLALAAVLPALIMQDACRMAFFAQSLARNAAANDALWALIQFGAIAALIRLGHADAAWLILAWGGGAAFCVVIALSQLRVVPDPRAAVAWGRRTWDLSRFFLTENLLTSGAFTGGFLLVGVLVGEGAVSAIRGAQVLVGPLETLSSAMFTFALPELSRRAWLGARTRWTIATGASAAMVAIALTYTAGLWLMPDEVGRMIFRDNWDGPASVLLPVALGSVAARACLGPAVTIYAMGLARRTFRLMLVEAPLVLSLMLGGAVIDGVAGAAWGLMINQSLLVPLWFLTLWSVLRSPDAATPPAGGQPHAPADPPTAALPVLDSSGQPYTPRHASDSALHLPAASLPPRGRHTRKG
ncbi:MAG: hypothetical protein JNL54_17905 [Kineosporiaceae bacterium]|nr:hypothetical protein [Kineosporiaceae bacterium]MBL8931998.1 hypothetical protein [Kineosporiaceae bacterium]